MEKQKEKAEEKIKTGKKYMYPREERTDKRIEVVNLAMAR